MGKKQLLLNFALGLLMGVVGGTVSSSVIVAWAGRHFPTIRANRFEAIGENGKVRASLAVTGDTPQVQLFASDGSERLSVTLDNVDEPIIIMRDIKGQIRVAFGHETSDTASPEDDDWSAEFRSPEVTSEDRLAALGTYKTYPSRKHSGFLVIRNERGQKKLSSPN